MGSLMIRKIILYFKDILGIISYCDRIKFLPINWNLLNFNTLAKFLITSYLTITAFVIFNSPFFDFDKTLGCISIWLGIIFWAYIFIIGLFGVNFFKKNNSKAESERLHLNTSMRALWNIPLTFIISLINILLIFKICYLIEQNYLQEKYLILLFLFLLLLIIGLNIITWLLTKKKWKYLLILVILPAISICTWYSPTYNYYTSIYKTRGKNIVIGKIYRNFDYHLNWLGSKLNIYNLPQEKIYEDLQSDSSEYYIYIIDDYLDKSKRKQLFENVKQNKLIIWGGEKNCTFHNFNVNVSFNGADFLNLESKGYEKKIKAHHQWLLDIVLGTNLFLQDFGRLSNPEYITFPFENYSISKINSCIQWMTFINNILNDTDSLKVRELDTLIRSLISSSDPKEKGRHFRSVIENHALLLEMVMYRFICSNSLDNDTPPFVEWNQFLELHAGLTSNGFNWDMYDNITNSEKKFLHDRISYLSVSALYGYFDFEYIQRTFHPCLEDTKSKKTTLNMNLGDYKIKFDLRSSTFKDINEEDRIMLLNNVGIASLLSSVHIRNILLKNLEFPKLTLKALCINLLKNYIDNSYNFIKEINSSDDNIVIEMNKLIIDVMLFSLEFPKNPVIADEKKALEEIEANLEVTFKHINKTNNMLKKYYIATYYWLKGQILFRKYQLLPIRDSANKEVKEILIIGIDTLKTGIGFCRNNDIKGRKLMLHNILADFYNAIKYRTDAQKEYNKAIGIIQKILESIEVEENKRGKDYTIIKEKYRCIRKEIIRKRDLTS